MTTGVALSDNTFAMVVPRPAVASGEEHCSVIPIDYRLFGFET